MHILIWILVGAVASGLGVGYALHQSNADRARLMQEARQARAQADAAHALQVRVAEEANQKLTTAANEIAKAQQTIQQLEEERTLIAQAEVLKKPGLATLKHWSAAISLPLGLSIQLPPLTTGAPNEATLIATTISPTFPKVLEQQWLSIAPYQASLEQEISSQLKDTTAITYAVQGRLLRGVRGHHADTPEMLYLLRVQQFASSTHLIWAKAAHPITEQTILDTLATLSFRP